MTDSELKQAFASIHGDAPIYRAIMQVIDQNIENATIQVSHEDLATNHGAIAHCAGGLSWLRGIKDEIKDRYAEAHPLV